VKSPCINVCVIDPKVGLCKGCARTLDEIARWAAMSDAEQEAVLHALKRRQSSTQDHQVPRVCEP